jgi:hypothetical protein
MFGLVESIPKFKEGVFDALAVVYALQNMMLLPQTVD